MDPSASREVIQPRRIIDRDPASTPRTRPRAERVTQKKHLYKQARDDTRIARRSTQIPRFWRFWLMCSVFGYLLYGVASFRENGRNGLASHGCWTMPAHTSGGPHSLACMITMARWTHPVAAVCVARTTVIIVIGGPKDVCLGSVGVQLL